MAKGADFEREICRLLSLWWSKGEDKDIFWRNRTRETKDSGKYQGGDIMSMKPSGLPLTDRYNIELKTGYNITKAKGRAILPWDTLDLIDGKEGGRKMLLLFWDQCWRDAKLTNRIPLLIFKRHHHDLGLCITFRTHIGWIRISNDDFSVPNIRINGCTSEDIILFRLSSYLEWLKPEVVRKEANENTRTNTLVLRTSNR